MTAKPLREVIEVVERLVPTAHVLCPDCGSMTLGPYHDPYENRYYDGHYCEDCALTWRWRESDDPARRGFILG